MPTEAEREVWLQVDVVLKDARGILDELQAYKGAGQEIREVRTPSTSQRTVSTLTQCEASLRTNGKPGATCSHMIIPIY